MTQTGLLGDALLDQGEQVEPLLIEISTRFISMTAAHVDSEIENCQRRICEQLGFDRSSLFQTREKDPTSLLLTHVYQGSDMPPVPTGQPDVAGMFPWLVRQLRQGRTVGISSLNDFPAEADQDRESLRRYGTISVLVVPLSIGGAFFGALTFASARERDSWPEGLVKRLQFVAEIFANAIERARNERELRRSRERYALAVDGANDGLWDWDMQTDEMYFSPRWKRMLGYEDHELADRFSTWEGLLHPEDRERALAALQAHLSDEVPAYKLEHRLRQKDGTYRWILARGKALRDSQGRPYRMAGSHADITERKVMQEDLRRRNRYIETILEQAPIGFAVHTIDDGVIRFVSARFEEIYRLPRGTVTSFDSFFDKVWPHDPDFREQIRSRVMADIATGDAARMRWENVQVRLPTGEVQYITAANIPLYDQNLMVSTVQDVTSRVRAENDLRRTLEEMQRLREQLQQQNVYLQQEVKSLYSHTRLVGRSEALQRVFAQLEQVAPTDTTVLLLGETGTGKELIASAIHELSPRRDHPMVRINCSAIPESLIESELFGREKGAYTGALSKQIGRFELANGSTLFLDEIGDLPPVVQVKLLRVLQEKQIERLGSSKSITVDVRIITATNKDLEKAIREGVFREDLYYRLNVFPITVPPLRERVEDIPRLVNALVAEFSKAMGKNIESIAKESMDALQRYSWPGNVRELRNLIERAMIMAKGPQLRIELPGRTAAATAPGLTLAEVDRQHIQCILARTGWRIRGKCGAAEILGLKPTTLETRIAKLGIRRPAPNGRT